MSAARIAQSSHEHDARKAIVLLAAVVLSVLFLMASSADRGDQTGSPLLPQGPPGPGNSAVEPAAAPPPMPEPGLDR